MSYLHTPFLLLCLAICCLRSLEVGTAAELDSGFDVGPRAGGDIVAVATQADGRIIVAGEFGTIQGTNRSYLARLHSDGSLDTEFDIGSGASDVVHAVALQPDGKILLGGAFWSFNGAEQRYLVRLHANGAVDATFQPADTIDGPVRALAIQADERIIIGGTFTTVAGQSRQRLARLHADGSLDTGFDPGTGANDFPRAIVAQQDGRILIAGRFTTFNGAEHGRLVRLTAQGAVDSTFNAGSGADRQIRALAPLPDGRFYIGGHFETYNGTNRSTVARLFPDGGLDLSFDQGNPDNDTVQALTAEPDGKVWIGGLFQQAGGLPRALVARLNADGTADASTELTLDNLPGDEVFALHLQTDGLLLLSGEFRSVNGVARQRLARVIPPGTPLFRMAAPLQPSSPEGSEVVFTIERIGPASGDARVNYATINGTAIGGADFMPVSGTLTFGPDERRKTVSVPLLPDAVYDPEESFELRLENPQGAGLGAPATGTARIREASPSIEFTSLEIQWQWHEGVSSNSTNATTACLGLQRTGYVPGEVWSVDYEIIPGTALPGEDFTGPLTGTVDLTGTSDFHCLWIPLVNDGRMEPTETLTVRLVRATGAVLTSRNAATLTIWDDDAPIQWAVNELKVPESAGQARLKVRRNDNGPSPVTVSYATSGDTALPNEDFLPMNGSVTLEPLQRFAPLAVTLLDDCRIEPDESLTLTLTGTDGGSTLDTNPVARVILQDNERPGSFDPTFDTSEWMPPPWAYRSVAQATDSAGGVLVGDLWTGGRIFRVHRDGSLDPDFVATNFIPPLPFPFGGLPTMSRVEGLLRLPSGDILVAAMNETLTGDTSYRSNYLVRLKHDGVLDSSFHRDPRVILGQRESPFAGPFILDRLLVAAQPDGKLLVNRWTKPPPGGTRSENLARLNPDGSLDENFRSDPASRGPFITLISALTVQDDGRILVAASFSRDGTNFSGVVRLLPDGALDSTFAPAVFHEVSSFGFTLDASPHTLVVQADGAILAGGGGNRVNGVPHPGLARLQPHGALDEAFRPESDLPDGAALSVAAVLLDERERILIGRWLPWDWAGPRYPVIRLLPDGQLDTTFQMSENDFLNSPAQLLLTDDRKIVIAGASFGLFRLNSDPAPRLTMRFLPLGGGLQVSTPTISGDTYRLEGTTDFRSWEAIETREATECSMTFLLPPLPSQRYFRIEHLPAR